MARTATADEVLGKAPREATVQFESNGEVVEIRLRAISSTRYDELLSEHPPTKAQEKEGETFNTDTFPPALISEVSFQPKLELEQTTALWKDSDWSRGELRDLFLAAVNVCNKGLDVPFTSAG